MDSTRTSLTGYTMGLRVRRSAGPPWRLSGGITFESPGFELSDLGRQLQSDDIDAFADIRYFNPRPGPLFRFYAVSLGVRSGWNFGGTRQFSRLSLEARTTWLNFLTTTASVGFSASALADNLTRGGPLMKTGGAWQVSGGLATNSNAKTRFRADATYYNNRTGTWSYEVGTGLSLQPSARFTVSVDPSYSRLVESRQYLTAMSRAGAATFGSRYVFAFVERSELAARFRLSYSLTPDLSLEVYASRSRRAGGFTTSVSWPPPAPASSACTEPTAPGSPGSQGTPSMVIIYLRNPGSGVSFRGWSQLTAILSAELLSSLRNDGPRFS